MSESAFEKYTTKKHSNGMWHIECKKGLWGVSAGNKNEATQQAMHYFIQYYMGGEYDD